MPQPVPVTYSFYTGKDMGDLFYFTASYVDKDNKIVQERIHSLPWNKTIAINPLVPFDAHLEVAFAAKDKYPDKQIFEVGFTGRIGQAEVATSVANAVVDEGKLRFSLLLPSDVSPADVNLSIAPLKYDKHFAFTFTVDDAAENAWSRVFAAIHRKWIDDKEFFHLGNTPTTGYIPEHTLTVTDGCGNDRRFGFGVAIWPTYRNAANGMKPRMQESSQNSIYITWDELRVMLNFGCAVHFHNVDETKYDKMNLAQLAQGFEEDYNKVVEKLGYKMKVLALPDGLQSYFDAGHIYPKIEFTRNSLAHNLIRLKTCGGLLHKDTYGGEHTSDIGVKLEELALQAASDDPYWVGLTVHRPQFDYIAMLAEVYKLYGKVGADNIWVASWDEVYEYQELRHGATIRKQTDGQTVTFEVSLPDRPHFHFRDLSFLLSGVAKDCTITPLSENIYGMSHAVRNGATLININFNPELVKCAEKYTAKYEASAAQTDKEDALYSASMLRPDLAAPFISRIENRMDRLVLNSIAINGGANTTYNRNVKISCELIGAPTRYRVGETLDLSASEWKPYTPEIAYILSKGFDYKTIYFQLGTGTVVSEVKSATILYADIPEDGSISREAVRAYQTKYNGYKVVVDKKMNHERR
ncbi:MAG: hypothetical protein RRZ83_06790 [Alistipes sp.]